MKNKPLCPCGNIAITTIVQMPACENCHNEYAEEGRKNLPMDERTFFKSFLDKAREQDISKAVEYTYYGY